MLFRRVWVLSALLLSSAALAGCTSSSAPRYSHVTASPAFCRSVSNLANSITAAGSQPPLSHLASPSVLASYAALLNSAASLATSTAPLAPSGTLRSSLSTLASDLTNVAQSPSALTLARGSASSVSDLASASQLVSQASGDLDTLWPSLRAACPTVPSSQSVTFQVPLSIP